MYYLLGLYDTIALGRDASVIFYHNWVNHVKETVPANRLLVFEPTQGWQPLCEFLDVPIPDGPFPYVNDTQSMLWTFMKIKVLSYTIVYGIPIAAAFMLAYIMYF